MVPSRAKQSLIRTRTKSDGNKQSLPMDVDNPTLSDSHADFPRWHRPTPPAAPQLEGSSQDSANDMVVVVGKSVLVDCAHQITRIAVGSGDLA